MYWDENNASIAHWDMDGEWTWAEFYEVQQHFHVLLGQCPHKVDVIADLSRSKMLPGDAFVNFRRAQRTQLPNRRHIVIVGAGSFVNTMVQTFDRVMLHRSAWRLFTVETLDEAYKILEQQGHVDHS
jgi:hypothetical protein